MLDGCGSRRGGADKAVAQLHASEQLPLELVVYMITTITRLMTTKDLMRLITRRRASLGTPHTSRRGYDKTPEISTASRSNGAACSCAMRTTPGTSRRETRARSASVVPFSSRASSPFQVRGRPRRHGRGSTSASRRRWNAARGRARPRSRRRARGSRGAGAAAAGRARGGSARDSRSAGSVIRAVAARPSPKEPNGTPS